uniref:NF-kappa-B essential modulator-like n=1 Tax=Oncorhynchus gorbuscha TaxID=8017 RepID=UPI001EAE8CD8
TQPETALKTDRLVITEERRKLAQLQHAYTCLFKDYDSKLKTEGGDMVVRLEEAERALALKQDLIDKLKEEVEQHRGSLETVPVLTAQVHTLTPVLTAQVQTLTPVLTAQ